MALSQQVGSQAKAGRTRVYNPYSRLPNWLYPAFVFVALTLFGLFVWEHLYVQAPQRIPLA